MVETKYALVREREVPTGYSNKGRLHLTGFYSTNLTGGSQKPLESESRECAPHSIDLGDGQATCPTSLFPTEQKP